MVITTIISKNKKKIMTILYFLIINITGMSIVTAAPAENIALAINCDSLQEKAKVIVDELKRENSTADFAEIDATLLSLKITLGSTSANDKGASLLAALAAVNTATVEIEQGMNKIIDQVGAAYGTNNGLGSQENPRQTSVKVLKERLTASLDVIKEQAKQDKQGLVLELKRLLEENSEDGGQSMALSPQEKSEILKQWVKTDPESLSSMMKHFSPQVAVEAQATLKKPSLVSIPLGDADVMPAKSLVQQVPAPVLVQKVAKKTAIEVVAEAAVEKATANAAAEVATQAAETATKATAQATAEAAAQEVARIAAEVAAKLAAKATVAANLAKEVAEAAKKEATLAKEAIAQAVGELAVEEAKKKAGEMADLAERSLEAARAAAEAVVEALAQAAAREVAEELAEAAAEEAAEEATEAVARAVAQAAAQAAAKAAAEAAAEAYAHVIEGAAINEEGTQFKDAFDISGNLLEGRKDGASSTRGLMGTYDYVSWGQWNDSADRALDYGYNMYWVRGNNETPARDIPKIGSATYDGTVLASVTTGSTIDRYVGNKTGEHLLTVDFGDRSVKGGFALTKDGSTPYTISLDGKITLISKNLSGIISGDSIKDGVFKGQFYGPECNEIGASFAGIIGDGDKLQGIIAAQKNK